MQPLPLNVNWQKNSQNGEWFDLLRLNLDAPYFVSPPLKKGVFVIWYINPSGGKVIKVGSGILRDQLKHMRSNPTITQYTSNGPIKVSWVAVNGVLKEDQIPGVEAYLNIVYSPIIGGNITTDSIPVKLMGE